MWNSLTDPPLKPQAKTGWEGWWARAQGSSPGARKLKSWREGGRGGGGREGGRGGRKGGEGGREGESISRAESQSSLTHIPSYIRNIGYILVHIRMSLTPAWVFD